MQIWKFHDGLFRILHSDNRCVPWRAVCAAADTNPESCSAGVDREACPADGKVPSLHPMNSTLGAGGKLRADCPRYSRAPTSSFFPLPSSLYAGCGRETAGRLPALQSGSYFFLLPSSFFPLRWVRVGNGGQIARAAGGLLLLPSSFFPLPSSLFLLPSSFFPLPSTQGAGGNGGQIARAAGGYICAP